MDWRTVMWLSPTRSKSACRCGFLAVGVLLLAGSLGTAPESKPGDRPVGELRTWTDRSGNYRAAAVLMELDHGVVTLRKKDGTAINVPLERLSDADRRYVQTHAARTGSVGAASPTSSGLYPSSAPSGDAAGDDDVRTDARDNAPTQFRVRTSYRSTARSTARTAVGSSSSRGTRRVDVEGVGATAEEALKDCFRKAVAVVVESIVDAETQVENDRLVLDRVLMFTDGFVDSYEELGTAYVENGLVHRRIVAAVRRDSLLLACGRAESVSVDASGLYPEVMTKLERRRSALALLRRTLDLLPGSLLQVQPARPLVKKLGDTTTALGLELVIRVDPKKYEALRDRMVRILPCLSRQDGTSEAYRSPVAGTWEPYRQELLEKNFFSTGVRDPGDMCVVDVRFAGIEDLSMDATAEWLKDGSRSKGQGGGTSLFIKGQSGWRWFDLDEDVELSPMVDAVVVAFRDSDGKEVQSTTLSLGPWVPGFAVAPPRSTGVASCKVFMSPLFLYCYNGNDDGVPKTIAAESVTVHGGVTLENELLSRVNTVDAVVRRAPWVQLEAFEHDVKQTERGLRRKPAKSLTPEEELAKRALIAQRARALRAAASARIRAQNAQNAAAFQSMWGAAMRRSGL